MGDGRCSMGQCDAAPSPGADRALVPVHSDMICAQGPTEMPGSAACRLSPASMGLDGGHST